MLGILGGLGGLLGGGAAGGGLTGLLGLINGIGGTVGGIGNLISQFQTNKTRKKLTDRLVERLDEQRAASRDPGTFVDPAPSRSASSLYGLTDLLNKSQGQM